MNNCVELISTRRKKNVKNENFEKMCPKVKKTLFLHLRTIFYNFALLLKQKSFELKRWKLEMPMIVYLWLFILG